MRKFGLIGYPLGHSFSAGYFTEKFDAEGITDAVYENIPLENVALIRDVVREKMLDGFNVTIPHKEAIIQYLDEMSPVARKIGAVNCVVRRNDKLIGHNTDHYGFRESLLGLIGDERPSALVLGTGGASKAVIYALGELGMDYRIVSTHPEKGEGYLSYDQLDAEIIASHRLIVNATPLGTFPDTSNAPAIPYELISGKHFMYDLVYNPPETRYLILGQAQGAKICNGYKMLTLQAEKAWDIFNLANQ